MISPSDSGYRHLEILKIAATVCTDKELDTLLRRLDGDPERDVAIAQNISRRTVRNRVDNAVHKIINHPAYPKEDA